MAYNSAYTGSQVDAAVGAVRQKETKWDNKQDELTGTEDQLVGFNSAGEAVAVAKPDPLPTGGETGQVLTKTSTGAQWDDVPSDLPAGGTDGQILTKTDDGVAWENPPDTGVISFNGRKGEVSPGADDYSASMIKFTDGQTFQQKYDAGQLTGPAGADGAPGATGPQGQPGQNATINGVTALTIKSGTTVSVNMSGGVATFEFDGDAADVPFTPGSTGMTATDVQAAITELFTSVSDGKSAIAAAITDKGVTTAADATFQQLADNIAQIQTGTDTSDATATAGDILSGKTAYGATGKLTGTIPSQNATTITPGSSAKTAIPAGTYAAGAATVAGDANLIAGNIKEGVSIFGVAGSFAGGGERVSVSISLPFMPIEYNVYYCDGSSTYKNVYLVGSGQSISVLKNTLVFIAASSTNALMATTSGGVSNIAYADVSTQYQLFFVSGSGSISL